MTPEREQHALATVIGAYDCEIARNSSRLYIDLRVADRTANGARELLLRHDRSRFVDDFSPVDPRISASMMCPTT
jgi:hypothetical protein